ncbi:MAG: DUF2786 domain-containing protein [Reyranella sp.]|uniref:DUF7168 domain-containing protein n=2 Tax=Reyranella sp. TaxID=1929291 RepID=UPI003D0EA62E
MNLDPTNLDRLRQRIQALRAKTVANGCTEGEALAAAAKVAELLDRYDLSLADVDVRQSSCEQLAYEVQRNKRILLDECVGAIAEFCGCRVWREKDRAGVRWVFFGLRADIEAACCLTEVIDSAVRTELGRYKTTPAYQAFRHQERHLANGSFTLGMIASIADKLLAMKASREQAARGTGRAVVVLKKSIVDAEIEKLGFALRTVPQARRLVSPLAYEAGEEAGGTLAIDMGHRGS